MIALQIVEWVRLNCGHVVDLTRSEQENMFEIVPYTGDRMTTCPKCDPRAAQNRTVIESSTTPLDPWPGKE